jgi:hypothetical protein
VSHQYLFMADTIFEHLKYQLDQNLDHFLKILGVKQVVRNSKIQKFQKFKNFNFKYKFRLIFFLILIFF